MRTALPTTPRATPQPLPQSAPADYAPGRNGAAVVIGSALIVIGAVALASQFGWFDAWRLWPLALIAIGGVLILNQRR